jgi:hypothetical protein
MFSDLYSRRFFTVVSNFINLEPLPIFKDAALKAQWAKSCTAQLNAILARYLETGVRVDVKDAETGKLSREVTMETDGLPPLGLPVGDILRNLRGALDAAVSAMYRAHGKPENHAYWPFADNRNEFENHIKSRLKKYGFTEISDFFLEDMECSKSGNFPLWALNKMDRDNKHRNITVVATLAVLSNPSFYSDSENSTIWSEGNRTVLEPGQNHSFFIPANATLMAYADSKPTLITSFGPSEILPGADVLSTLYDLHRFVIEALHKFQNAYVKAYP